MTSPSIAERWAGLQQTAAEIDARAKRLNWRLVLLTLAIALPYALGWLARSAVIVVWWVASRVWTAALVGWEAAAPKSQGVDGGLGG